MRFRAPVLGVAVLALTVGSGIPAHAAPGTTALTVRLIGAATKTTLHLQPGFATVVRADHRIDTVAIGDPRLVTATTVKRGQDVYDLVLQPQSVYGATNMVVWFGDLTSIWELVIGTGQRSADIVFVVTAAGAASRPGSAAPRSQASTAASSAPSDSASAPSHSGGPGSEHGGGTATGAAPRADPRSFPAPSFPPIALPFLEARQTLGDTVAAFTVLRARDGVVIRYRITNNGGEDLAIRLSGILVRVNGRLVPFGMIRDSADRDWPAILPRGGTETGVIDAPGPTARQVEVIFSLFPVGGDRHGLGGIIPLTFQPMFSGVDRLATAIAP